MIVFSLALTFACFVLMFLVSREYKLAIMFMATILMSLVTLPFKGITALMVISFGFILSEVVDYKQHWLRIKGTVILPYLSLVAVLFVLAVATSEHLHNVNDLGYFALSEVMVKHLALVYGFLALRRKDSMAPLVYVSFGALILMTAAGIANYIEKSSFMVDALFQGSLTDYDYITADRFRVQATFLNPFDYGYMCVLLALVHLYAFLQHMEGKTMLAIAQVCCLFGVVTCNCRTVLFCYGVCALLFVLCLQKESSRKFKIVVIAFAACTLLVWLFPFARKTLLSVMSIFDASSNIRGSSLGMRILQLGTVLYYISGSARYLLFGRGVHFFELDLGWEDGSTLAVDSDLYGLEGVYLNFLLERGIVGLLVYLAMMTLIAVYIIRHRRYGLKLYAFGLSVFALYIIFSFMTGELLSFTPAFYILGYVIANQTLRERIIERKQQCEA